MRRVVAIGILLVAMVGGASFAEPSGGGNPKVRTAIAKPMEALDLALAAEATAPPAASDRERLERLGKIDQSWRRFMGELDLAGLSPEEVKAAYAQIAARTEPIDRSNLAAVMAMRPKEGWFTISAYGKEAAEAAFHIVQHGDLGVQERLLPYLAAAAAQGEVKGPQFAAMYDRVQVRNGKPQRYGTQFRCEERRVVPYPLENPGQVEDLRRVLKFEITFAEHARGLAERGRC